MPIYKYSLSVLAVVLPALTWGQGAGPVSLPPAAPGAGFSASGQLKLTLPELRDRLAMTAQQQPLWTGFEARVAAYLGLYYREKPVQPGLELAATRQFTQWLGQQQNRLAALEDVDLAAKALYASLDPTQQQLANQFLLGTLPGFAPQASCPGTAQEPRSKSGTDAGRGRGMRGGS
ncbi:MAG: hypothetical protein PHQ58_06375 [Rhodoferax sp.]|uniref:hypothetical protein n=1 Tax=Rhodoferax sp. TaxID=50421 RepID=UPI002609F0B3|nr:hypothetical protein [Rhodoferax sp.]MDD2880043.1 hypothetical protein [Rhodoferax sp.]